MASSRLRVALLMAILASIMLLCTAQDSYADLDQTEIEALGLTEEDLVPFEGDDAAEEGGDGEESLPEEGHFTDEGEVGDKEIEESSPILDADVIVLSSSNFSTFLAENVFAMVEFYAPWCGHCQALAPEYAAAATELHSSVSVPLAKVDATMYQELAQKYDVDGYPTILFFVDGKPKPYLHHRTREAIVTWVKKKVGPGVMEVTTVGDADTVLETGNVVAAAFFDKLEGHEVEEFAAAAQKEDDVLFYQTTKEDVAEVFSIKKGTKAPAVVLLKNASERVLFYDGVFEKYALCDFVSANKLPLVSTFSRETASEIFESSIKKQLLLFASGEEFGRVLQTYEEAARTFKGKIIFVHVDTGNEEVANPIIEYFGILVEKPTIVGFTVSDEHPKTFLFEDEFTVDKIKVFAAAFLDGKLKQFYKSEPIPTSNDGDVKVVVGKNFDEIVLDESRDVLLEVYAPWCGHCQALAPIYEKLGKALRGVESLVIAKMDGTANDHARVQVDGFPTLLFFPAGNKSFDPIVVDADLTVKGLYQFLKHNAGIPFTLSKKDQAEDGRNQTISLALEEEVNHQPKDEL